LAARGTIVSREIVRHLALKFGQNIANRIRGRLSKAGGKWYLNEVARRSLR
jgi:putative transposase